MVLFLIIQVSSLQAPFHSRKSVKGYKFNVGKVMENSILELEYHEAIIHPSFNTKLCEVAEVPIVGRRGCWRMKRDGPQCSLYFTYKRRKHTLHGIACLGEIEKKEKEEKKRIRLKLKPQTVKKKKLRESHYRLRLIW